MPASKQEPIANDLLAALPLKDYQRLLTGLKPVELIYGQVLYEPGGLIQHVYFPNNCLVSLLTAVDKQRILEVGMVGYEGMVGMPLALGYNHSAVRALVQGTGMAMRMTAKRFLVELKRSESLRRSLSRYTHFLMAQVSQTAACNRFHNADARLARWLLMTADCLDTDEYHLTQEFLADMLGIRRVGVTKAASVLQQQRLIEYSRGHLKILNRQGLEAAACTCYRIIKDLQIVAQVAGPGGGPPPPAEAVQTRGRNVTTGLRAQEIAAAPMKGIPHHPFIPA